MNSYREVPFNAGRGPTLYSLLPKYPSAETTSLILIVLLVALDVFDETSGGKKWKRVYLNSDL